MIDASRWTSLILECVIGGAVVAVGVFGLLEPTSTERAHLATRIQTIEARIASGCSKLSELGGVSAEIEDLRARLGELDARITTIEAPDRLARAIRDAAIDRDLVVVSDSAWTRVEIAPEEPVLEAGTSDAGDMDASASDVAVAQRSMHVVGTFEAIGRFVEWLESREAAIDVRWMEMRAARDRGENDRRLTARLRIRWSSWRNPAEEDA